MGGLWWVMVAAAPAAGALPLMRFQTSLHAWRPTTRAARASPPLLASSRPPVLAESAQRAAAPARRAGLHLKVDGRWYDVSAWAERHPGGRYVLEWADGFDVTNAFHTIHLFSSKRASEALRRLPEVEARAARGGERSALPEIRRVPVAEQKEGAMDRFMALGEGLLQRASPPMRGATRREPPPVAAASGLAWQQSVDGPAAGRVGDSPLRKDLEALLHRHFSSPAEYKATREHWVRIGGAAAAFSLCFTGWLHASTPETILLPFAQWLLFSPTVHEASHSTLSTKPWVNKAASFCGLPFIYNPYIWWPQHILSHHQYTNDDALDVDLHHLRPARLHPGCEADAKASGFNFMFKGYFSTIGMSALWPTRVLERKSTGRWYENLITPKPELVSDAEFGASFIPVIFVLVWPWLLVASGQLNLIHGFFIWFYPWAVTGAIWTVMTQVSHVQEDCQRPPTGEADDYFRWQVESAIDYSVNSELVPKLTATLNLQSMHHVMPSVCGCHFARLYPEYRSICEQHGVRLNVRKDLSHAWRSTIERVFELSSPALTPAWAVQSNEDYLEHAPLVGYIGLPVLAFFMASPLF